MPQFDCLIIFSIIKDLTILLPFYYFIFINLIIKNMEILKFRTKILKFKTININKCLVTVIKI